MLFTSVGPPPPPPPLLKVTRLLRLRCPQLWLNLWITRLLCLRCPKVSLIARKVCFDAHGRSIVDHDSAHIFFTHDIRDKSVVCCIRTHWHIFPLRRKISWQGTLPYLGNLFRLYIFLDRTRHESKIPSADICRVSYMLSATRIIFRYVKTLHLVDGFLQPLVVVRLFLVIAVGIVGWEFYPTVVVRIVGWEFRPFDFLCETWFELYRSNPTFGLSPLSELRSPGPFCPHCRIVHHDDAQPDVIFIVWWRISYGLSRPLSSNSMTFLKNVGRFNVVIVLPKLGPPFLCWLK